MKIALTGNPNSGKTTMYNALTGRSERVGNWAGVTVEKKESPIKRVYYEGEMELIAVDLPGAYSMSPFTSEESITSTYVKNENPDVIINIVDATNLSRSLFFTTQLLELGIPIVVALNKSDINDKKETEINVELLSQKLGCPVVETISTANGENGLFKVVEIALSIVGRSQKAPYVQEDIDLSDKAAVEAEDRKRFQFVNKVVKEVENRKVLTKNANYQDRIDEVITSPWLGIPIFAVVMYALFYISQSTVGTWIADALVGIIGTFQEVVGGSLSEANPFLRSLLVEGIIGGVGAVIGFLPLVMVMYFLIALLEDCGYMARATVVLDPIFKKVGLSGRSVIPMVIGTGCAIPGVMACRTIRDERERRATAMLAPFMPCGAKIPVIALFAGAFFPEQTWVAPVMYLAGVVFVFLGALLVKAISGYKYKKSFFIIELPEYKIPSLKRACFSMFERGKAYIIKAGTIILICNAIVQIMSTFTWSLEYVEDPLAQTTILETIASPIAVLLIPLGFGAWQFAAAAVTGFIAKENVVGTIAVVFEGLSMFINSDDMSIPSGDAAGEIVSRITMDGAPITAVVALAFLMFNLFTPPCFAAIGAMNSEMKSKKWLFSGIALQFGVGYTVAFLVYQIGTLITKGSLGTAFVPGLIAVLTMVAIVVALIINSNKKIASEYSLKK